MAPVNLRTRTEPAMPRFGIYAVLAVLVVTLGMIFGGQLWTP